jgi:hypothetical protein
MRGKPLGGRVRGVEVVDGTAAPRGDRDPGLLGQQLGLDLVAEPSHRVRRRSDEDEAEPLAQLRERRVLGNEPPPHPDGVGPRRQQRPLELGVVGVGAAGVAGVAQADGLVGEADEHGAPLRLGVQRDDGDAVPTLFVQLTDGSDQPDRRLTPVDDGDPSEHVSPASPRITAGGI